MSTTTERTSAENIRSLVIEADRIIYDSFVKEFYASDRSEQAEREARDRYNDRILRAYQSALAFALGGYDVGNVSVEKHEGEADRLYAPFTLHNAIAGAIIFRNYEFSAHS